MLDDPEQLRDAESAYREAISQNPGNASMDNGLGNVLYAQGRWSEAEAAYRKAISIDPAYANAHCGLGDALRKSGHAGQAEAAYREAIGLDPSSFRAYRGLGFALCDEFRFDEAEEAYRNAIRLKPSDANSHHGLGDALQGLGRFGDAEGEYRNAIRMNPGDANSRYGLGNALRALARFDEAAEAYQRAIDLNPEEGRLHAALGNVLLDSGNPQQAAAAYRNAIGLDPGIGHTHRGLGDALLASGDSQAAIKAFHSAIKIDSTDVPAHMGFGDALRDLGRFREAEREYRKAIELSSEHAPVYLPLGRLLRATKRNDIAADAYLESLLLDPGSVEARTGLRDCIEALGSAHINVEPGDGKAYESFRLALQASGLDQSAQNEARSAYRLAIFLAPGDAEAHRDLGDILNRLGRTDEATEEYRQAIEVAKIAPESFGLLIGVAVALANLKCHELAEISYRKAAEIDERPPEGCLAFGQFFEAMERFDEAIDAYRKAMDEGYIDDEPDLVGELLDLGEALCGTGSLETAAKAYRAVLEVVPKNAVAHMRLGHALREIGCRDDDTDESLAATDEYNEAIELDPTLVSAHNGLGLAMLDLGGLDEAEGAFREAILLAPADPVLHFNLGFALCAMERFEEAAGALAEAIRLNPDFSNAHRYFGDAVQALGRLSEAAESYHRAIRLDPDNARAHDGLEAVLRRVTPQQSTEQPAGQSTDERPSGQFIDDLRTLAFWYASVGVAEVPLLGSYVPEGLPDGLVKKRARLLELSARDVLPAARVEVSIAALVEAELQGLEDRNRVIEILRRRTFAVVPETLDAIGNSWGVTRERVRQIESKGRAQLVATLNANTRLGVAVAAARRLIGTLLPLSDLLRLLPALADEIGSVGQPAWRVLSALDEAYEIEDGWCATPAVQDAKAATGTWLQEFADKHGVADMSGFTLLHSKHVALPEESTRDWLAYCGYKVHEDWILTRTSTIGDRVAATLSITGSPLSAQEIQDHEPESRSLASLRNALGMDERFERVDRDSWALTEWGLEPYNGIRDQIHQELARSGGEISIGLLIERVAGQYSVAESSVRAYAGAPPFESSNGRVRFATGERASNKTLTSTRRLYQREDSWLYRVTITGEHLRGSGSVAPVALASQVGLQPGSSCRLDSPLGPQLFSWASLQPAFGTIQRFLLERNIVAGQQVFLVVGCDLSFDIRPVDADRTSPLAMALSLTGAGTVDAAPSWPALARAIGLPEDSHAPSVIAGYRDRGDTDVADLLQAIRP